MDWKYKMSKIKNAGMVVTFLIPINLFALGFSLTEENDFFVSKDNNYTQGLELSLDDYKRDTNGVIISRYFYGIRSRIYTPKNIEIAENQPKDRPWACTTAIFYDTIAREGIELVKYGIELGVLGPAAGGKIEQTEIHRLIGATIPQGWSNQVPNELSLDLYMTRYLPFGKINHDLWSAQLDMPYGGTIGTTYDNLQMGLSTKIGYNIPPNCLNECISPKVAKAVPFIYLLADSNGKYVFNNATLGHSFFRNRNNKWNRTLIHGVTEWDYGVCAGWKNFAITYLLCQRSEEFVGQPEEMKWGMIKLEFMQVF